MSDRGDEHDPFDGPPDPLDRVWSHPSEIGGARTPAPPPRPRRSGHPNWAIPVLAAAVGSLATLGVVALFDDGGPAAGPSSTAATRDVSAALASEVSPSVVGVRATTGDTARTVAGVVVRRTEDGGGELSSDVVTSYDAVHGADEIVVVPAGRATRTASVVGVDPTTDLALLRFTGPPLPSLLLDRGAIVEPGQTLIVVGATADGTLPVSTAAAALDIVATAGTDTHPGVMELTVTPDGHPVGGAVVDTDGQLVGVVTDSRDTYPSGSATPARLLADTVDQLREWGAVIPGWIGLNGRDDPSGGVEVVDVVDGGPADLAGIRAGDQITDIGDDPLEGVEELVAEVVHHAPGSEVTVTIASGNRRGDRHTVTLLTAERP
ncbi:MAG: S1C family serine protease [Acidimicrobiia bacterium]|nr:S1C family serine protease [Acidimicrobiia bacterium]